MFPSRWWEKQQPLRLFPAFTDLITELRKLTLWGRVETGDEKKPLPGLATDVQGREGADRVMVLNKGAGGLGSERV